MANMSEIHNYLLNNKWEEIEDEFNGKTRVYKTTWNLSSTRSQVVWARLNDTSFQIASPFAKEGDLSAERALKMNMTLLGVDVQLGHYCLVCIGTVANFSASEFETLEKLTASFADDMEMNSGGGDVL